MAKVKFNNDYEKTGVLAVDMVASCVSFYRRKQRPLKTIFLKEKLFIQLEDWLKKKMGEEKFYDNVEGGMKFDDVNIERGSPLMLKDMYWDFYPSTRPEDVN